MTVTTNRFLKQLNRPSSQEEEEEENKKDVYTSNRFLRQIKRREPKLPFIVKANEKLVQGAQKLGKEVVNPRNLMQGAIGAAKGTLYTSPAAVPAIVGELALPGAIEQSIREEEEFHRDLPPRLREALDLPEFKPDVARQASQNLINKITGGKGIVEAVIGA